MTNLIACIADDRTLRHARVGPVGGTLQLLEVTPHFAEDAVRILDAALASPYVTREWFVEGEIGVDAEPVAGDDPRLLDMVAQAFRSCGLTVVLHDAKRAEAWHLLRMLPLELDIRDTLSPGLGEMPDEDLDDLLTMLSDAKKEVDAIADEAAKERAAVIAKTTV